MLRDFSSHQLLGLHKNEFGYYATAGHSIVFIFHFVQSVINNMAADALSYEEGVTSALFTYKLWNYERKNVRILVVHYFRTV
jgi:hypothetical protein